MKLTPLEDGDNYSDDDFYWVGHPGVNSPTPEMQFLIDNRDDLDVMGGVVDEEASYEYDEMALVRLGSKYWLLATSGCSCPSPYETWRIELGPATLKQIRQHVTDGSYDGYTLPGKQMSEFLDLLDEAEKTQPKPKKKPTKRKKAKDD